MDKAPKITLFFFFFFLLVFYIFFISFLHTSLLSLLCFSGFVFHPHEVLLFTIYSHNPNFNAKGASLPKPCPSCSSKSEAIVSVLRQSKVKRTNSFLLMMSSRSLPHSCSCIFGYARARAHPSIHSD